METGLCAFEGPDPGRQTLHHHTQNVLRSLQRWNPLARGIELLAQVNWSLNSGAVREESRCLVNGKSGHSPDSLRARVRHQLWPSPNRLNHVRQARDPGDTGYARSSRSSQVRQKGSSSARTGSWTLSPSRRYWPRTSSSWRKHTVSSTLLTDATCCESLSLQRDASSANSSRTRSSR